MEIGNLSDRVALCFSGQVRTAIHTIPEILNFIGGISYADTFIHTWDTNCILPFVPGVGFLSNDYTEHTNVDQKHFDFISKNLKPLYMKVDNIHEYDIKYQKDVISRTGLPPVMRVGMFHSMYEANKLKCEHEKRAGSRYRYVFKLRLDTVYDPSETITDQIEFMTHRSSDNVIYTKDFMNKLPKAIEDVALVGNSDSMDIASNFIKYRESDKGKVLVDWQHMYSEYLKSVKIEVRPWLNNNLYIYRQQHRDAGIKPHVVRDFKQ